MGNHETFSHCVHPSGFRYASEDFKLQWRNAIFKEKLLKPGSVSSMTARYVVIKIYKDFRNEQDDVDLLHG